MRKEKPCWLNLTTAICFLKGTAKVCFKFRDAPSFFEHVYQKKTLVYRVAGLVKASAYTFLPGTCTELKATNDVTGTGRFNPELLV